MAEVAARDITHKNKEHGIQDKQAEARGRSTF
jgi:hypothetical protein